MNDIIYHIHIILIFSTTTNIGLFNYKRALMAELTQDTPSNNQQGILYVVATPIGNLDDISKRVVHTLASVSKIAAEDTRKTKVLLSHLNLDTPCFSFHEHNERQKLDWLVQQLQMGDSIALVSDAGTPLISDPGYPLVRELRNRNMKVIAIPGPCALITALSVSGLATDRFTFEGFFPSKVGARKKKIKELANKRATQVFYESSHRIKDCLADLMEVLGEERQVVIARELTKTFETLLSGTTKELVTILESDPNQTRGEFVVIIEGNKQKQSELPTEAKRLAIALAKELPGKKAAKIVSETFDCKKNQLYDFILKSEQ